MGRRFAARTPAGMRAPAALRRLALALAALAVPSLAPDLFGPTTPLGWSGRAVAQTAQPRRSPVAPGSTKPDPAKPAAAKPAAAEPKSKDKMLVEADQLVQNQDAEIGRAHV